MAMRFKLDVAGGDSEDDISFLRKLKFCSFGVEFGVF